jgi:hypothetical protein
MAQVWRSGCFSRCLPEEVQEVVGVLPGGIEADDEGDRPVA